MADNILKLADNSWTVASFKIKEMKILDPMFYEFAELLKQGVTTALYDKALDIIMIAINRVDPAYTRDAVESLTISRDDLFGAIAVIATSAGRIPTGEPKAPQLSA